MRVMPRRSLVSITLMAASGCGSAADLSIGSQADTGSPRAASWRLLWRDDFDRLDPARWEVSTHTFAENYAELEGTFDPQTLPVSAIYDWVEVYEYVDDTAPADGGAGE
jgi:hypothetical protein